jgi:hypothetical protein
VLLISRKQFGLAIIALMAVILLAGGCSKSDSDSDSGSTITFNLTLPPDSNFDGKTVRVGAWNNWGDSVAYKTADGTIDSLTATVDLTGIPDGTYQLLVVVDVGDDGFGENPVDPGDYFWGTLDLAISQNRTINLTRYYWQQMRSVIFGVQDIPSGNDGRVCAVGLFEPGADVLGGGIGNVCGGAAIIYNNSAILAVNAPEGQDSSWQLPSGDYDVWSVVDIDGQPEDWFTDNGQITDGDLIDSIGDWSYNQAENDWIQLSFSYRTLSAANLSFSVTMPEGYSLNGHKVYFGLWENWGDNTPAKLDSGTIVNNQVTKTFAFFTTRTYQGMIIVDVDNSGAADLFTRGDLIWGILDLTTDVDQSFGIPGTALQEFNSMVFGVNNIPYGHNGMPLAMALVYDGQNVLKRRDRTIGGGVAMIYNNSAVVAVGSLDDYPDSVLNTGDYDVWFVVDVDGQIENFDDSTYWPVTVGDLYYQYNYHHQATGGLYFNLIDSPSFEQLVGVSGTITCPTWVSGGGPIYVLLFNENPLQDTSAEEWNWAAIAQPGTYQIPIMPNLDVYAVGYWDADSSGDDGGPTAGDMIGGFSEIGQTDSLTLIDTGESGSSGKDFELDTVFGPLRGHGK